MYKDELGLAITKNGRTDQHFQPCSGITKVDDANLNYGKRTYVEHLFDISLFTNINTIKKFTDILVSDVCGLTDLCSRE